MTKEEGGKRWYIILIRTKHSPFISSRQLMSIIVRQTIVFLFTINLSGTLFVVFQVTLGGTGALFWMTHEPT